MHLTIRKTCWIFFALWATAALGHGVAASDLQYLEGISGTHFAPYMYLGAKHMVTGYDHLLFLCGVVFFLYGFKDVALYVTLFAIGHSVTLLFGTLSGVQVNPYLVDAVIGLSIVYKAIDNLRFLLSLPPLVNTKAAVFGFGLVHGFGLATKLQEVALSAEGLLVNMIAFNTGVEAGQIVALSLIVSAIGIWRRSKYFARSAYSANLILMSAGLLLFGYQVTGYFAK